MKSFKQHLAEETAEDIIKMVPGGKDAEAVYETWVFIVARLSGSDTSVSYTHLRAHET